MDARSAPLEYKTLGFELTPDDLEPNHFAGYLAAFGNVDDAGDLIYPGAFKDSLPEFLQAGIIAWQHNWDTPIGKPLEAREDGRGLYVKARVSETTAGKDALTLMRDGVVTKLSIGYKPLETKRIGEEEGIGLLGEAAYKAAMERLPWHQDSIRGLLKIQLFEGSPVSVPANRAAVITGVKGGGAGLPYADHYSNVQAALEDFLARTADLVALRAKDGRQLSAANRAKIQQMRDHLQQHIDMLEEFLAQTGAPMDDMGKAARYEYIRFLQREAALHGA